MDYSQVSPAVSLALAAQNHPERQSIIYGSFKLTVSESQDLVKQISRAFQTLNLLPGARVAVVSRNSPYHLLVNLACDVLGLVFVPISYRLTAVELNELFEICAPSVVLFDLETVAREDFSKIQSGSARFFIIADDVHHSPEECQAAISLGEKYGVQSFHSFFTELEKITSINSKEQTSNSEEQIELRESTTAQVARSAAEIAALLFTSGSSGKPKAVGLTREQLWWGNQNFRQGFEYSNLDVLAVVAPLSHIGGYNGTTMDIFSHGGTVVLVREFLPKELLQQLHEHKVSMMFAVPAVYNGLLQTGDFSRTFLPEFTKPLIGGAVAPVSLLEKLEAAGFLPINVWGMTETSASGACLSQDNAQNYRGSIGLPFLHNSIRVINPETLQEAEVDQETSRRRGELLICGASVIRNYWNNPEADREGFYEGYLRTGDLVEIDSSGMLWVMGRLSNIINTAGVKVSAEEVIRVYLRHPLISDCYVVGIPDPHWSESVALLAVLDSDRAVSPELSEMQDFARGTLAGYKIPRHLKYVESIPLNSNGKVDREAARQMFLA